MRGCRSQRAPTEPLSLWAETFRSFRCINKKGCVQSKKRWACDLCNRVFSGPGQLAMHWTKGHKNACAMEMRSRIPLDASQSNKPETKWKASRGEEDLSIPLNLELKWQ